MNDYVFVTAQYDFADEFYCQVIFCGSQENLRKLKEAVKKFFINYSGKSAWFCFGTNEYIEIQNYEQFEPTQGFYKDNYREYPISFEEYQRLIAMFNKPNDKGWFTYGTGDNIFDIEYWKSLDGSCPP